MESQQIIVSADYADFFHELNTRIKEALQNEISEDSLGCLLNDCLQYFDAPLLGSLTSAYDLELSLLNLSRKYWQVISAPFKKTADALKFEEATIEEHINRIYFAVKKHSQIKIFAEKSQQVIEEPPALTYEFNCIVAFAYLYTDRKINFFNVLELIARNAHQARLTKTAMFSGFFSHLLADYFDLLINENVDFVVLAKQVKMLGEILDDSSCYVIALAEFITRNQKSQLNSDQVLEFILNQLIHLLDESIDKAFLPGGQGKLLNLMDSLRPLLAQTSSAKIYNLCDVYACKLYARIDTNTFPSSVEYRLVTFWFFMLNSLNIEFSDQIDLVKIAFLTPSNFSEGELTLPRESKDIDQEIKHLRRTEVGDFWILASLIHLSKLLNPLEAFKPFKEFKQAEVMEQLRNLEVAVQTYDFQNEQQVIGYHRNKLRLLLHFLPHSFSPIVYVRFFRYINKVFKKYPFFKLEPDFSMLEFNFLGLFPDKALIWLNQLVQDYRELLNFHFDVMVEYKKFADEIDPSFYKNWNFMMLLGFSNNSEVMKHVIAADQKPKLSEQDSAIVRKLENLEKTEKTILKKKVEQYVFKINENLKFLNESFLGGDFNFNLYSEGSINYFKLSLPYLFVSNEFCLKLRDQKITFGFSETTRNDAGLLKTKKQRLFQDVHSAVLEFLKLCKVKTLVRENGILVNLYRYSPKKEWVFNYQAVQMLSEKQGQLLKSLESIRQKYLELSSTAKIMGAEKHKTSSPMMELEKLNLPGELKAHIRGMLQEKEHLAPKVSKAEQNKEGKKPLKQNGPGLFERSQKIKPSSPPKQEPANDNAELEGKTFA